MKYYYLVIGVTYHYAAYYDDYGSYFKPAYTETKLENRITHILPALYIIELKRQVMAAKLYNPTSQRDGSCYDITFNIHAIQEIDEGQAQTIMHEKNVLHKQQEEYKQQRREEQLAATKQKPPAKQPAKEHIGDRDLIPKHERWYKRLWQSIYHP